MIGHGEDIRQRSISTITSLRHYLNQQLLFEEGEEHTTPTKYPCTDFITDIILYAEPV